MLHANHTRTPCASVRSSRQPRPFTPVKATQPRGRECTAHASRRDALSVPSAAAAAALLAALGGGAAPTASAAATQQEMSDLEPMEALRGKGYGKPRMKYGDYTRSASGLQFIDLREGSGDMPQDGDTCVVDWDGYTIGYYGRPFEARNKPKGSSFTGENKDYLRFTLGKHAVIPAFEEAVAGMKVGGIRRIIVPIELGYPEKDWRQLGPKPSTFAGERALDFVLSNRGMIDKTLLYDIELMRIQK